ncbi:MAG TPA: Fic family protein [Candidatus Nanoarchaeia archaeon]|nr:Fic family protein [Candidatus Nanoarchaeia archaeon]
MTFIRARIIHGKERHYLEHSIRLPDGTIKKLSIYLKDYNPAKEYPHLERYQKVLQKGVDKLKVDARVQQHQKNDIFTEELLRELELTKIGYQKIIQKLTPHQLSDMLDRFSINFTYESNAIEGNSLTLKDVTFLIKEGEIIEGKNMRDVYETINTRKAFDWIMQHKPQINEKDILKLHEILVKDTEVSIGYKKLPNFLLGRLVKTTAPAKVGRDMKELIDWYNKNMDGHPLQQAALFHGRFEKIHPFEDGNGRVGRLLINIILLNHGYAPLIIRKTQRVRYFHALDAFDHGHPDNLYWFLIEKYKKTYGLFFKIYIKYLK